MEIEFFCHPDESMKWYQYWRDVRINWYTQLGIKSDQLRPREQGKEELAHYSIGTTDIEYLFPFCRRAAGTGRRRPPRRLRPDAARQAQRQGHELLRRGRLGARPDKASLRRATRRREQEAETRRKYRFMPHVIEPSAGADRSTLAVLCEAYAEDDDRRRRRGRCMRFHPRLAPIKAAVLPLVNKDGMPEMAQKLLPRAEAATSTSSTTTRARSAAAIAARTRPARRSASPSTARRCRTRR